GRGEILAGGGPFGGGHPGPEPFAGDWGFWERENFFAGKILSIFFAPEKRKKIKRRFFVREGDKKGFFFCGEGGQGFPPPFWGQSPYPINFGISRIMPVGLTRLNSKVSIPSYEAVGMHASVDSIMSPFFPIACARLRHSRSAGTHLTVSSVSLMGLSIDSSMRWFSRSCAMYFGLSVARSMRPWKTAWACPSAKLSRISATMRPM